MVIFFSLYTIVIVIRHRPVKLCLTFLSLGKTIVLRKGFVVLGFSTKIDVVGIAQTFLTNVFSYFSMIPLLGLAIFVEKNRFHSLSLKATPFNCSNC